MRFESGDSLHLPPLPPYEDALLSSLAFFRKQARNTQALNCLAMYLRQSDARVMGEIRFYAKQLNMEPEALLMLIHHNPGQAETLLKDHLQQVSNLPE
jgi:hypothetical protein